MTIGRSSLVAFVLLTVALGACGSDSGSTGDTGTELKIEGVVTAGSVAPDPNDPTAAPDPDEATEIDISGDITCDGSEPTGTGAYEMTASDLCRQLTGRSDLLRTLSDQDPGDLICTEIYGGPQHASITGSVDGIPVDIDVERNNGCGIETWQQLEWLLGPPER